MIGYVPSERHQDIHYNTAMIAIHPEQPLDYPAIFEVNKLAFGKENEARLVETLRQSHGFIAELSLVTALDNQIVGHILFSPVVIETSIGDRPVLALAPLAVRPDFQNQGIGSELVRQGLEACHRLGHRIVVVLGHSNFYPRFGFVPARPRGVTAPFPVPDEAWMVLELQPGALSGVQGTVRFPPAFDDV
jgi:putative acetyltransferase